jgi:hypothetical protein
MRGIINKNLIKILLLKTKKNNKEINKILNRNLNLLHPHRNHHHPQLVLKFSLNSQIKN